MILEMKCVLCWCMCAFLARFREKIDEHTLLEQNCHFFSSQEKTSASPKLRGDTLVVFGMQIVRSVACLSDQLLQWSLGHPTDAGSSDGALGVNILKMTEVLFKSMGEGQVFIA